MATDTLEPRATGDRQRVGNVLPFTVEAADPRNGDLILNSVAGVRMRSKLRPVVDVFTREDGEQVTSPAPAGIINGLPSEIPGMRLRVDPAKGEYQVTDPLRGDDDLCERIRLAISRNQSLTLAGKLRGVPTSKGSLERDHLKTLVREMCWLVSSGSANVVEGSVPAKETVDAMPGDYLTHPRGGGWHQPRYEKDMEEWERTLNSMSK